MYDNKSVQIKNLKGKKIIKKLFMIINKNPKKFLTKQQFNSDKHRAIADFVSGMTDRYAINLYECYTETYTYYSSRFVWPLTIFLVIVIPGLILWRMIVSNRKS